jgi:tetratricopeptide (TPR) repeat protein
MNCVLIFLFLFLLLNLFLQLKGSECSLLKRQRTLSSVFNSGSCRIRNLLKDARQLKDIGNKYMTSNRIEKAVHCYSAALQLVSGIKDEECSKNRLACGIAIGKCQTAQQNFANAVARFTEVINELVEWPETLHVDDIPSVAFSNTLSPVLAAPTGFSELLGTIYLYRSGALRGLKMYDLALLDLHDAVKYLPDEITIYQDMALLEDSVDSTILNSSNSTHGLKSGKEELLESFILDYPNIAFSDAQLKMLLSLKSEGRFDSSSTSFSGCKKMQKLLNPRSCSVGSSRLSVFAPSPFIAPAVSGVGALLGWEATHIKRIVRAVSVMSRTQKALRYFVGGLTSNKAWILPALSAVWLYSVYAAL